MNMMEHILTAAVLLLLCSSCTSSHFIGDASDEQTTWTTQFNDEAKGRRATITLMDSSEVAANDVQCGGDSLSFVDSSRTVRRVVPVRSVSTVTVYNRTYGTIEGIGWGILGGPLVSVPFIAADRNGDGFRFLVSLAVSSAAGAVIGGVTGSVLEHKHVFHFRAAHIRRGKEQ